MFDELTDTLVLIHPHVKDDHHIKKSRIGLIISKNVENGMVMLSFGPGEQFFYQVSSLLVLRNPDVMFNDLVQNANKIKATDFKLLLKLNLLLKSGFIKAKRKVIKHAMHSEIVCAYCMQSMVTALCAFEPLTPSATIA